MATLANMTRHTNLLFLEKGKREEDVNAHGRSGHTTLGRTVLAMRHWLSWKTATTLLSMSSSNNHKSNMGKTKKEEESHSIPDPDRPSDRTIKQFKIGIKARLMAPSKGYILKLSARVHRKMHELLKLSKKKAQRSRNILLALALH